LPLTFNHKLFLNASFLEFATRIDIEFSEKACLKGCLHCGGTLHFARYQRKGRLIDIALPDDWGSFHSLCCSAEGCRKRVRPLSIRYAGQSPFNVSLFLLAELIQSGGTERSIISLSKELSISERTIRRWLLLWKKIYTNSTWWRKIASVWMLSGKTLNDFWSLLLTTTKIYKDTFQYLLIKSAEIWSETKLFVTYKIPAKDA
jgi:hypothetical protein